VLQKGDVVARYVDRLKRALPSLPEQVGEARRSRQGIGAHGALDPARHSVDEDALEAEEIAGRGDDGLFDTHIWPSVRDHVREILQDEDETSAGVVNLVLEFVRRIERIDINDDAASQQNPENQSRIG